MQQKTKIQPVALVAVRLECLEMIYQSFLREDLSLKLLDQHVVVPLTPDRKLACYPLVNVFSSAHQFLYCLLPAVVSGAPVLAGCFPVAVAVVDAAAPKLSFAGEFSTGVLVPVEFVAVAF